LIDPFDDMGYSKTVTVESDAGAFKDYFNNNFAAMSGSAYKYTTVTAGWSHKKSNNVSVGFSARMGSVCYATNSTTMMLYGGKTTSCQSDLWTSTNGSTWTKVADKATTTTGADAPLAANAPTAIDADGCVWLLGGDECNSDKSTIWKSCDAGLTWMAMPSPTAVAFNSIPASWPTNAEWTGHAIAIVGGWQLVIVKAAADGGVWKFLNSTYVVQKVAEAPLPFENRLDPKLMTTSDNKLYLLGGHNCKDMLCTDNMVMSDLWMSADTGATWECQTMGVFANSLLSSTITEYSKGIGRYYSSVITGDDTVWILAGHQPNTTQGLNRVYTSYVNPPDTTFSSTTYLGSPTTVVLKSMEKVAIFFKENIQMGAGTIRFTDGTNPLPVSTTISAQGMHMFPLAPLVAGTTYTLQMPAGSVKDTDGNPLGSISPTYTFHVNSDTTAPVASSYPANAATNVSPDTVLMLSFSEEVVPGTGALSLNPVVGTPFTANISSAIFQSRQKTFGVYQYDVYFEAKSLTQGATYIMGVPAGLVKDIAGNSIAAANVAVFTVLSGMPPAENPYTAATFTPGAPDCSGAGACNATLDTVKPTFVSMFPKNGATDVIASANITSIVMQFSEPVKFNETGVISIKNSSNIVVGMVNLTTDVVYISPQTNETKIPLPAILVKGMKFTVSIPTGIIKDLAGNSLTAISKSFTCLAESPDATGPVALSTSFDTSANTIDVFFSEMIKAGPVGTGTVKAGTLVTTPITHGNITMSGFKLSLSVYAGALTTAGTHSLQIAPGTLKDASGSLFTGLNGSSIEYTTTSADTTAPTLVGQAPPHETSPTFGLPTTASMMLTFSESVQAAPDVMAATLTPVYGYNKVEISTADVYIDQNQVILTGSTLMPGESYGVVLGSGAFMDLAGNSFAGLATGVTYSISTHASMGFELVSTGNWDAADYFDGKRYGSCAFVDPMNILYLVGGINGTAAASTTSMMNDVWSYESMRESSCSSSVVPYTCPSTACTSETTLAVVHAAKTVGGLRQRMARLARARAVLISATYGRQWA
jgi:hypothetical protein